MCGCKSLFDVHPVIVN